jgi:hypothetical protein
MKQLQQMQQQLNNGYAKSPGPNAEKRKPGYSAERAQ